MHCTKISPEFEFGGQRSKINVTRDKRKSAAFFESGPRGRDLCRPPVLRRWENQRMLSSIKCVKLLLRHNKFYNVLQCHYCAK